MRVEYFLSYSKPFYPTWNDAEADALIRLYELPLDRTLKALSRGMRIKAALASSPAHRPRLIVLDEPFSGLFGATEQTVRSLFEPHGTVGRVNICTDRDSGQPRGLGFVEMDNDGKGEKAIAALKRYNLLWQGSEH